MSDPVEVTPFIPTIPGTGSNKEEAAPAGEMNLPGTQQSRTVNRQTTTSTSIDASFPSPTSSPSAPLEGRVRAGAFTAQTIALEREKSLSEAGYDVADLNKLAEEMKLPFSTLTKVMVVALQLRENQGTFQVDQQSFKIIKHGRMVEIQLKGDREKIGSGSFSTIYKTNAIAIDTFKKSVSRIVEKELISKENYIKKVKPDKKNQENEKVKYDTEIKVGMKRGGDVLNTLSQKFPDIKAFEDPPVAIMDPKDGSIIYKSLYYEGKSAFDFAKSGKKDKDSLGIILQSAVDLTSALEKSATYVVNLDGKPDNYLFTEQNGKLQIKWCDWGGAQTIEAIEKACKEEGQEIPALDRTPAYLPYEYYENIIKCYDKAQEHRNSTDFDKHFSELKGQFIKAQMYSQGLSLYTMLTSNKEELSLMNLKKNPAAIYESLIKAGYKDPLAKNIADILKKMLLPDSNSFSTEELALKSLKNVNQQWKNIRISFLKGKG